MLSSDLHVFAWVVQQMQHGASYYDAMGYALRHGPGPAGSVFNWRPPLLYFILAQLPWSVSPALWGLLMSEVWAGLAIVGSSLLTPKAPRTSIVLAGLAGLLRELALPYVIIRCVLGWRDHRRLWAGVLATSSVYYAVHWMLVVQHQLPRDYVGPAWITFAGVRFLLATVTPNPLTLWLGPVGAWLWLAGVVAVVLSSSCALADRVTLAAYLGAFLVVGHPEPAHTQAYWGFVVIGLQAVLLWQWVIHVAVDGRRTRPVRQI